MNKKVLMSVLLTALLISACGGNQAPAQAPAPVEQEQPAEEVPAPAEPAEQAPQQEAPAAEAPKPAAPASGGKSYTAPEGLFTLDVPKGWAQSTDQDLIDDAVVDTFTSPDGGAFVQVVVHDSGIDVSNVEKGQITLDFMKRIYGDDLRVASDVTLPDGREKLEWWSDDNNTTGTTFFNRVDEFLYFYTTYYQDAYEGDYKSTLTDVNGSFSTEA